MRPIKRGILSCLPHPLREVRRSSRECPVDIRAVERAHRMFVCPGGNRWGEWNITGIEIAFNCRDKPG